MEFSEATSRIRDFDFSEEMLIALGKDVWRTAPIAVN
jgi:hypothetical protein